MIEGIRICVPIDDDVIVFASRITHQDLEIKLMPMRDSSDKPWWVDYFGSIASITSAVSAVIFGLSAAYISYSVAEIQKSVAVEAAKSRDNDALIQFSKYVASDNENFHEGIQCISVITWLSAKNNVSFSDSSQATDEFFEKLVLKHIDDVDYESSRTQCLTSANRGLINRIYLTLNPIEMALINWNRSISKIRKKTYYRQLYYMLCDDYSTIGLFSKVDNSKFKGKFLRGAPNLRSFLKECSIAKPYATLEID